MTSEPTTLAEALAPMTPGTTPTAETAAMRATRPRRRTRPTNPEEARAIDEESPMATGMAEAEGEATGWTADDVPMEAPRPRRTRSRTMSRATSRATSRTPRSRAARRPDPPPPPFDAGADSAAAAGTSDPREIIGALADAGQAGAARKGNATVANWTEFLTVAFGFLGMLYAWWLVAGLDVPREAEEQLALTEEEAEALATPAARILARSWVNVRWGKNVLGAGDYIMLAIVMTDYVRRTSPYLRRRLAGLVPGLPRRRTGPLVDEAALRRRAAEQGGQNGHVASGPGEASRPVIFPVQAT